MACHEGGWMQKRNHETGRQGAQLEKEQQRLGQNKKAARQRQDRGRRVNAAVAGETPARRASTYTPEGCKHPQHAGTATGS